MSISEPETGSLREGLETALAGAEGGVEGEAPGSEPAAVLPTTAQPPQPEFKIPEKWPQAAKEQAQKLLALPDGVGRAAVEAWHNHWKEREGVTTRREQELSQLRQQFDPIHQVLAPVIPQWQMQGMSPQQGLSQLVGVAQYLARDPAAGIKWIAEQYGLNLAQLVEQQGYVAPEVQTLQQKLQQMEQQQRQWQFQQQQQQQQAVFRSVQEQLTAFESAVDASGNPKWPHYGRLQDRMAQLISGGVAKSLEDAYSVALRLDDDIQREEAAKKAQADAAQRAAEATRAKEASRTVRAKGTASTVPDRSMRDELKANLAAAGFSD